mmetsp:Transcript_155/g.200  ORF Transcript_155/g.200 Transcript_155/m.200 type:complete len:166 (+) Transcript_155:2258-2755(+)
MAVSSPDKYFNFYEKEGLSPLPTQLTSADTKDLLLTVTTPRRKLLLGNLPQSLSISKMTKAKSVRYATPVLLSPKDVVPRNEIFKSRIKREPSPILTRGSAAQRLQGFYISVGKNIEVALTSHSPRINRCKSTKDRRKQRPPLKSVKKDRFPMLKQLYARSFVFF